MNAVIAGRKTEAERLQVALFLLIERGVMKRDHAERRESAQGIEFAHARGFNRACGRISDVSRLRGNPLLHPSHPFPRQHVRFRTA